MTSTFTTVSSIGCIISKTRNPSAEGLSSFSSISSASLGGWKDKVVLQRRCTPKIQAAAKEIKFDGGAAAKNFGTGAKILADAVKNTLGTDGRNVAIESKFGSGKLEDYGATGGNDQIGQLGSDESYGAEMVSQSASKTTDLNGNEITEGVKVVAAGADPIQITRGIEKTAKALAVELKLISEEVQDSVGKKDVVKMQFDSGYISPYFVTNRNKMIVEYDNCKLLLVDKKISKAEDLAGVLEEATKGDYPIVIIAEDIEGEALASLVTSKLRSALKVAAVKAPGSGKLKSQYLDDIAILTGGTVIREEVVTATSSVLGNAAKIVISEEKTTIVSDGSTNEEVDKRVDQLKNLAEAAELDSEKKQLNERIAKLNQVPAEEGIKVGGGSSSTLLRLSQKVDSIKETLENDEQKVGADIVKRSLSYTMDLIAKNAGTEKVLPDENPIYGYNVATGKYEDPSTSFDIAMRSILHFLILNEQSMY